MANSLIWVSNKEIVSAKKATVGVPDTIPSEVSKNIIKDVAIYTITGKQVFEKRYSTPSTQVDFTLFHTGVYFIRIKTNKGTFIEKVIN